MTFFVDTDEGISDLDLPYEEIFEKVARASLLYTGCPYECEVDLTLTDDSRIHRMNLEYRGIDNATDVLSFPMAEFDKAGDFSKVRDNCSDCFNPDTGEFILGDIVISVDHVLAQAKEYGHSVMREFSFLIAHSMLHLQGFDHIKPEDAKIMENAQNEILDGLNIRRRK